MIPDFDFHRIWIAPWTEQFSSWIWIFLMGFFVISACGLIGNYLILRRMSLVGDAVSHSILPGLVGAFLLSGSRDTWVMFIGALVAGFVTTWVIHFIHQQTRIKQDAAIGITFSTLFALGVVMISFFADRVDLDQDCVLYGEIAFIPLETPLVFGGFSLGPPSVIRMAAVFLSTLCIIVLFYKELLVTSFDSMLVSSLGIRSSWIHYGLMTLLSLIVVSAFESAGAILVIAMLILPGATAYLFCDRLRPMLVFSIVNAALSSFFGIHLAIALNCSIAAAMVIVATGWFCLAWVFSPTQGLLKRISSAKAS